MVFNCFDVAPRVGAWIETSSLLLLQLRPMSHPVWVRGLKRKKLSICWSKVRSHPVWVRGLKHELRNRNYHHLARRTPCGCVD